MSATGLTLDLYHLDSAYLAWRADHDDVATFEFFTRSHPFGGAWVVTAGQDLALDFITSFTFDDESIDYVRSVRDYEDGFLETLREHRFTGEVRAMPEGTVATADEPILQVTAPFRQALLLESGVMRLMNASTLIATKAARVVEAAGRRPIAEFGLRRAHEPLLATRAAWIGGVSTTSYVDAGKQLGIPVSGTVPHAVIQSFATEEEAFRAIAAAIPEYTLLLDTYDVERAARLAVRVAKEAHANDGHILVAVRLDSGDLGAQAVTVRSILDDAGLDGVQILASGDLDEFRISDLVASGAPIDAFGVGTSIGTGAGSVARGVDGGALACVYKLVAYAGAGVVKEAEGKATWGGRKQVWRVGAFTRDVIGLADEPPPEGGTPLLHPAIEGGERVRSGSLGDARALARNHLAALPADVKRLVDPSPIPVVRTDALERARADALERLGLA